MVLSLENVLGYKQTWIICRDKHESKHIVREQVRTAVQSAFTRKVITSCILQKTGFLLAYTVQGHVCRSKAWTPTSSQLAGASSCWREHAYVELWIIRQMGTVCHCQSENDPGTAQVCVGHCFLLSSQLSVVHPQMPHVWKSHTRWHSHKKGSTWSLSVSPKGTLCK